MLATDLENQSQLYVVAHTENPSTQEEEMGSQKYKLGLYIVDSIPLWPL